MLKYEAYTRLGFLDYLESYSGFWISTSKIAIHWTKTLECWTFQRLIFLELLLIVLC